MSRTIKEISIRGKLKKEIYVIIQQWIERNKIKVIKKNDLFINVRMGIGLITAPKYFEIFFKETQDEISIHIEGFIKIFWIFEMDLRRGIRFAFIPREQGLLVMENLCLRLKAISDNI
ncbi:MAG: hypothetical protein KAJ51_13820 [Thermoplasmata archaeon]|nr:hypothetical protein [Thermoplasmata archaeon]